MSDLEFLSFDDYVNNNDDESDCWITIARMDDPLNKDDSLGVFSCLATKESEKKLLETDDWEIDTSFGIPYFYKSDGIKFNTYQCMCNANVHLEPLVILREFHNLKNNTFDIAQNFILYHKLFFDYGAKTYVDLLAEENVIEYVNPNHIRIRRDYLRDYLAARNMILVRYHDYRRCVDSKITDIFGQESKEFSKKSKTHNFGISINRTILTDSTTSLLHGKDIILPYSEPKHEDYVYLSGKPKPYESYVYKINDDGKELKSKCDEKSAGELGFLVHIYFKKEVLKKYYDKTNFYKIQNNVLFYLDLWSVEFGEIDGLIHVWLGDLGQIPHVEQMHWKEHNIAPRRGLDNHYISQQLMAEFGPSSDLITPLFEIKTQLNDLFQNQFQFKLFKKLAPDDQYLEKTLHTLILDNQKEFDEQILILAKLFVETIDKKQLKKNVCWRPEKNDDTSLSFLYHFLDEKTSLSAIECTAILNSFKMIQNIRSISSAHIKSSKYRINLQQQDLKKSSLKNKFAYLILELYRMLNILKQNLS